jgi:RNA polymerase sigma-70 factor (ECF subfamily)
MNASTGLLWNEFSDRLLRFIAGRVGDPATAEDLRQDVFLRLHRRLGKPEPVEDIEAWLYRSARNAIIDHYRTRKPTVEVPETLEAEADEAAPDLVELRAAFRRMILSLPEPYRDAVILADLEGLKQQEVADRLGLTLPGAKSRVQRGRDQLRALLHACCSFEFDRRGHVIECSPNSAQACAECAPEASDSHPPAPRLHSRA